MFYKIWLSCPCDTTPYAAVLSAVFFWLLVTGLTLPGLMKLMFPDAQ